MSRCRRVNFCLLCESATHLKFNLTGVQTHGHEQCISCPSDAVVLATQTSGTKYKKFTLTLSQASHKYFALASDISA